MKKYKIESFLIHKIDDNQAVIQTKYNTILIKNEKLISFLMKLDKDNKSIVSDNEIQIFFYDESKEVTEFLVANLLIKNFEKKVTGIENIRIVTDDNVLQNLLYKSIEETTDINLEIFSLEDYLNTISPDNTLVICFLNKFHQSILNSVLNKNIGKNNSYLLLSYIYNHNVIFNCLFSEKLGLPCPKCTKGILDGQVYEENGGTTYQQLLKMIYEIDESLVIEYPLTYKTKFNITLTILKQLNLLALDGESNLQKSNNHNQDYSNIFKLELPSDKLVRDTAIYWELCDCYDKV